ncbi:LPXTG cell wall anchor domain-containing protein [Paenibacillus lutimineralis]|uniref:LPXTG cell wall anchor domain-containing protein n=1 Tax=Paenibacillus lutimineralis TaxID=2707005 RepID=A0A3S9V742_9BACL|nr:LPXTG cell wall anchor domain-containing protein [Paenibacillus lutimineralis]
MTIRSFVEQNRHNLLLLGAGLMTASSLGFKRKKTQP